MLGPRLAILIIPLLECRLFGWNSSGKVTSEPQILDNTRTHARTHTHTHTHRIINYIIRRSKKILFLEAEKMNEKYFKKLKTYDDFLPVT